MRRDDLKPDNETLIYEIVVERFSLDPNDYDCRTTETKLCFIRLPPNELLESPSQNGASQWDAVWKKSLHKVQSKGLRAFQHLILKHENDTSEHLLRSKLISFLLDENYFDYRQDRISMATRQQQQQHLPTAIEPISEFLFVSCLLDSTDESKITQALTDGNLFADVRILPQMTILSPGKSVIEHLQRSRRIKMALIEALAQKMQTLGPDDDF